MRFNLGEVWKSVEVGGGEPRRAVVIAIDDDGRRGNLFFDDGDEQSSLWAELTQAGKWHLDTSPKPTRGAAELKGMILRKVQGHPACPAGMSVEIRPTNPANGADWEALPVPPPGQHVAYADCAHYISTVASALRSLYGVRLTRVEASTGVPTGWMKSDDGTADQIVHMAAERQRQAVAANQSGTTYPFGPSVQASGASAGLSVNRAGTTGAATDVAATVGGKLTEQPIEIREAARALSKAIADQIAELNASNPTWPRNEPDRLAQQQDFVAFLETIAASLVVLAEAIDRAITAGSAEKPEPVLLGTAGEIARQLGAAVGDGIERNHSYIVDCTIKFGVFAAGFTFLHAIGVDGLIASVVAGLMNVKLSKGDDLKK
jgi:hypothetical protein